MWKKWIRFQCEEKEGRGGTGTRKYIFQFISKNSADAILVDEEGKQECKCFPWHARPSNIDSLVDFCTGFRLEGHFCEETLLFCDICVNEEETKRQWERREVEGIPFLVCVLSDLFPRFQLHTQSSRLPSMERKEEETERRRRWARRRGEKEKKKKEKEEGEREEDERVEGNKEGRCRWKEEFSLYPHQESSVEWMRGVERMEGGAEVRFENEVRVPSTPLYVDVQRQRVVTWPTFQTCEIRGGVLTNETGSGKTAVALRMVSWREEEVEEEERRRERRKEDVGKKRRREEEEDVFPPFYRSRATLVIVPVNIVEQWESEIGKFLSGCKLVRMVCKKDFSSSSMKEILTADVVLTTSVFLLSRAYMEVLEQACVEGIGCCKKDVREGFVLNSLPRMEGMSLPILHCVEWERVILDEFHELNENAKLCKLVQSLSYKIAWGMTATPGVFSEGQYRILCSASSIHPCLVSRMTHEMVRGCERQRMEAPPSLQLVEVSKEEKGRLFSTTEEAIKFVNVGGEEAQKFSLPSGGKVSLFCTYEDVLSRLMEIHEERIKVSLMLDVLTGEWEGKRFGEAISRFQFVMRNVSCLEEEEEVELEEAYHLEEAELVRRSTSFSCPICYSTGGAKSILSSCGHVMCSSCSEVVSDCPLCRSLDSEDRCVVPSLPTKVKQLFFFLVSMKEPVIVFSQWKTHFKTMSSLLKSEGKKSFLLEGTTHRRASVLRNFSDSGGVLFICLKDSFTGMHLPTVKVVIFSHAPTGSRDRVTNIEQQAIARAMRCENDDVRVLSLVAKGTSEERHWRETHSDSTLGGEEEGEKEGRGELNEQSFLSPSFRSSSSAEKVPSFSL